MKKLLIISLLCIFCFNIVGFYALFGIQLFQVRQEMLGKISEGVQQQELIRLRISSEENELLEFESSKEFYYEGAMYDLVKKQRLKDGSILLSCFLDAEETALLKAFSDLLQVGRENHKKKNNGLKLLFKLFPKINRENDEVKIAFSRPLRKEIFKTAFCYTAPRIEREAPPPRQV